MIRLDDYPTHELYGIKYRCGRVYPYGATLIEDGVVNFSIASKHATACSLVLFHRGAEKPYAVIPFPEEFRVGDVYSMVVYDLNYEDLEYGYLMDGPYNPKSGHRFDKNVVLLDPYAKLVAGREVWGVDPRGHGAKSEAENGVAEERGAESEHGGTYPEEDYSELVSTFRGRVIPDDYEWDGDRRPEIPMKDLVIYEAHVRGFTMDPDTELSYKGTFSGIVRKIPYLKELGVNCVELLPVFEFDELENPRTIDGNRLVNYWGYSTVAFYAPKSGYAMAGPLGLAAEEMKHMVRELHEVGIEVILDVVFNHTAEGDEHGRSISFRGIDNKTYYLLTPDGSYYNFSGCGNTMNCNNPVVRGFILDCLRYWVSDYHIDGFRFDLAAILSRDPEGEPMKNPPLLEHLAQDPILGKCKLIAEAWDAAGLYQVGKFPEWKRGMERNRWAEWNGRYRDCLRGFLKSGAEDGPELVLRMQGSPDLYGRRGSDASVNFITCHDGFTLYDLVSYNEKHNEMNGEDNRDGTNDNRSWNCGVEGPTDDPEILHLRKRQAKNAFALLLLSRGVPMLLAGDEFLNTQFGNNNVYCQDNEVGWLDWDLMKDNEDTFEFVKKMIALRKVHPVIRRNDFFVGENSTGYPEMSFHGTIPWDFQPDQPFLCFGLLYAEPAKEYGLKKDSFIYSAVNAFWEEKEFFLPELPGGHTWRIVACTSDEHGESEGRKPGSSLRLQSRSLVVLEA